MNDLIARLTSWKTTILGIVTLVFTILVAFGVLKTEDQAAGVEHVTNIYNVIVQLLASIGGLILIFSHDSPPKT